MVTGAFSWYHPVTVKEPAVEDSIIKKAARKVKAHKKTTGTISVATIIAALQMFHVLGPMVCNLPFIHDTEACLESSKRAGQVAKTLDQMTLDAGVLE